MNKSSRRVITGLKELCIQIFILLIFVEFLLWLVRLNAINSTTDTDILSLSSLSSLFSGESTLTSYLLNPISITLGHMISISSLSLLGGITIGICTGGSALVRKILKAPVDFFRGIPASLLILIGVQGAPLFSDNLLVLTASVPCTAICIFLIYEGFSSIDDLRIHIYEINNHPKHKIVTFFSFVLPSLLPRLAESIKLIVPYSLVLAIALEMITVGSNHSVGKMLYSRLTSQAGEITEEIFSTIFIIGIISFILCKLLERLDAYAQERTFT